MEFISALGICRLPALAGVQEFLGHTTAWAALRLLKCFSARDLIRIACNSDGDTKAVLVVWWCLPRARQALMLMLVIVRKSGNKVQVCVPK